MIPTLPTDFPAPDDDVFFGELPHAEPGTEDADDWWLDLGRVEFPGLPTV